MARNTKLNPWTRQELLARMDNPANLDKALLALYARQTLDEQATKDTRYLNGRGFSAFHAKTGTRLAQYVERAQPTRWPDGSYSKLGPAWRAKARKIVTVHIGQLVDIANGTEE